MGPGVSPTVYVAVAPATGMAKFLGLTVMLKSLIRAGTDVCASTMLSGEIACTVPPLKAVGFVELTEPGVRVMVTVAVDPDCSETGPQLMLVADPPAPHVPELMVALTLLTGT